MPALMNVLRRTWLATALFALVASMMWWILDWEEVRRHVPWTLLVAPMVWWFIVGRLRSPGLFRGAIAGALTGVVTQLLPHVPGIWGLLSHQGEGEAEAQIAAGASMAVYLAIGSCALLLGAVTGIVALSIERRTQQMR
jgi:hypothetical protein